MTSPFIPNSFTYGDAPQGGAVMPMVVAGRDPSDTTDNQYDPGYLWLSALNLGGSGLLFYNAGNQAGTPTWTVSSSAAGALNTLSDGSTVVFPSGGNIALTGSANQITVTSSAPSHELVFSIPTNFIAPGSISSTTTLTAGTDLSVGGNASVTGDLAVTGNETVGGNLTVTGTITFGGLTVNGTVAFNTAGAGTTTIGNAAAGLIKFDVGSGNFEINGLGNEIHIGDDLAANLITIGSETGLAATTIQAGQGDLTLTGAVLTAITVGRADGTGTITLGRSTAGQNISIGDAVNASAQVISIGNGASAANSTVNILSGVGTAGAGVLALGNNTRVTTIGIGNVAPAAARTTTIAGGNQAQNDTVSILNGAPSANTQTFNLMSGTATGGTQVVNLANGIGGALTINMGNGVNSTAQTINIADGASAANSTVNILSGAGTAGAGVLALGSNTRVTTIGIGNVAPAAARTTTIAGGNQAQNDTVSVLNGNPSANTQTFNLMSGTATGGTQVVNLANGIGGALTINMGNGVNSTAQTINIGNGASAANSTVSILSGVGTAGAGTLALGNNTRVTVAGMADIAPAASRTVTVGGGTITTAITDTIDIGPDGATTNAGATKTVNVNTGGVTLGSVLTNIATGNVTSGTHTTDIASGTGTKTVNVGNADGLTTINLSGTVLKATNPAFLAYLAATANNKTGAGTSYTIGTDALTEVYDRGSNFNVNGTFTAPVTGIYDLRAQVTLTGATIATTFVISIVSTARTYTHTFIKAAGAQDESVFVSALADMTATDTAHVTITVSGEAGDTVDILGAASAQTYFCGCLVA